MTADIPLLGSTTPLPRGPVYDRLKRHEIEVLREAGFSIREVAHRAHVSPETVQRILAPTPHRTIGRPPIAERFEADVVTLLGEHADLPTVEIRRRLREQGYSGGKNPVYQLVRRLQSTVASPMVRFEVVWWRPGELRREVERAGLRVVDQMAITPHIGNQPQLVRALGRDRAAYKTALELEEETGRWPEFLGAGTGLLVAARRPGSAARP